MRPIGGDQTWDVKRRVIPRLCFEQAISHVLQRILWPATTASPDGVIFSEPVSLDNNSIYPLRRWVTAGTTQYEALSTWVSLKGLK